MAEARCGLIAVVIKKIGEKFIFQSIILKRGNFMNLFEIEPQVWEYDDDRIKALYLNQIDQNTFLQLRRNDDPWEFMNGKLRIVSEEEINKRKEQYINSQIMQLQNTGGLNGQIVHDNRDVFKSVYPELKDGIDVVDADILKENCIGCALNKKYAAIMEHLMKTPYDGRDLSPLASKLTERMIRKLKGEQIIVLREEVKSPDFFSKRAIPKLQVPLDRQFPNRSIGESSISASNLSIHQGRKSCYDCVKKHIFTCIVLCREILWGYTKDKGYDHEDYFMASLEQAIDEAQEYQELFGKLVAIYGQCKADKDYKKALKELLILVDANDKLRTDVNKILAIGYLSEAGDRLMVENYELAQQTRWIRLQAANQKDNLAK